MHAKAIVSKKAGNSGKAPVGGRFGYPKPTNHVTRDGGVEIVFVQADNEGKTLGRYKIPGWLWLTPYGSERHLMFEGLLEFVETKINPRWVAHKGLPTKPTEYRVIILNPKRILTKRKVIEVIH